MLEISKFKLNKSVTINHSSLTQAILYITKGGLCSYTYYYKMNVSLIKYFKERN